MLGISSTCAKSLTAVKKVLFVLLVRPSVRPCVRPCVRSFVRFVRAFISLPCAVIHSFGESVIFESYLLAAAIFEAW